MGLGGLPPFAGFMSKWQIFVAGFETQHVWVEILIIFAALNSVFPLDITSAGQPHVPPEPSTAVMEGKPVPAAMSIPLVVMTLVVIAIGLLPVLVNWLTIPAGASLFAFLGF